VLFFAALMMSLYVGDRSGCSDGVCAGATTDCVVVGSGAGAAGADSSLSWGAGVVEMEVSLLKEFSSGRLLFRTRLIVRDMLVNILGVRGVLRGVESSSTCCPVVVSNEYELLLA
jgi:hypothetical protein